MSHCINPDDLICLDIWSAKIRWGADVATATSIKP